LLKIFVLYYFKIGKPLFRPPKWTTGVPKRVNMALHSVSEPPTTLFAGLRPEHEMKPGREATSQVLYDMKEAA